MSAKLGRFATAAQHYLAGRAAYSPALFARLAERLQLDGRGTLLDLGCGPAQIAIALAPHMARTIAMDPEPAMLAEAGTAIEAAGAHIELIAGGSDALDQLCPPLRLVTMGRSFHWMDRAATLAALDRLAEPEGAIALLRTNHPLLPDNGWRTPFAEALAPFEANDPHTAPHRQPGWLPHEAVLLDSAFPVLERLTVIERRRVAVDVLVRRAFSQSRTAPARLGEALPRAEAALRSALAPFTRDGMVQEVVESEALLAFRPA